MLMYLELKGITKKYAGKKVVDDLNIEFNKGIYGILGPNGAGKTTLMNMITTLIYPNSGSITLNGKSIYKKEDSYRNIIGYMPQDIGVYPNFTARKQLEYVACLKGLNNKEADKRIQKIAYDVNLADELDKKCGKYSGGMRRRLGLACALLNDPKILILDEPTAGLDPLERIRFRNMISAFSKNMIVIISTHIVTDIENISDYVLMIKKGKLLEHSTPLKLLEGLDGKIWTLNTSVENFYLYEDNKKVTQVKNNGNDIHIRFISDSIPFPECKQATPEMEDMYMYYFKEDRLR